MPPPCQMRQGGLSRVGTARRENPHPGTGAGQRTCPSPGDAPPQCCLRPLPGHRGPSLRPRAPLPAGPPRPPPQGLRSVRREAAPGSSSPTCSRSPSHFFFFVGSGEKRAPTIPRHTKEGRKQRIHTKHTKLAGKSQLQVYETFRGSKGKQKVYGANRCMKGGGVRESVREASEPGAGDVHASNNCGEGAPREEHPRGEIQGHLSGQRQRVGVEEGFVQGTDDQGQAGTWQCRGFPCVTRRRTPLLASSHRALFGFVAGCCSANAPHDDFDAISVAVARARPAAEVVPGGSFPIRAPLRPPEVGRASSSELHSRHEEHCER
mmetsp:Transcript_40258/g.90357  ORF Transcript_40258/g.90357 Transcript_40258/m.90357 type:complete len:321 (-) Transcript_40258:189-1151(-)